MQKIKFTDEYLKIERNKIISICVLEGGRNFIGDEIVFKENSLMKYDYSS